jgi:hypothetical protein
MPAPGQLRRADVDYPTDQERDVRFELAFRGATREQALASLDAAVRELFRGVTRAVAPEANPAELLLK